jgi:hypothetical protein
MNALQKFENELVKKYRLPDARFVYTPNVYWYRLDQSERNSLHNLRSWANEAYSRMP